MLEVRDSARRLLARLSRTYDDYDAIRTGSMDLLVTCVPYRGVSLFPCRVVPCFGYGLRTARDYYGPTLMDIFCDFAKIVKLWIQIYHSLAFLHAYVGTQNVM